MTKNQEDMNANTRFRNLNWEKTRSFYIIAKTGSFTKAANFLRLHQSALSRQIIDLEKTLGTTLFIREPRGVRLTRKGEELYSIIETTFTELTSFTHNVYAETNGNKKRKIRIATTQAITAYILNKYILSYNKEHPHLIFELVTDDQMLDIVLNDVDIAIRPFDSNAKAVHQELLFTLEKRLYASSEYLEKYGEPQTVEELKDHQIIAPAHVEDYPYSNLNWILKLGLFKGELHEPIYRSTSLEALVQAAKEGIGIIGGYEQMEIIKNSDLKNILPDIKEEKMEWYFIYPESLQNDKEIVKLKNYLHIKFNEKY